MDLDQNDISRLIRGGDKNYQLPHSGYDCSLKDGKFTGWYSAGTSHTTTSERYSPIADQDIVPALASDNVPEHFSQFPLRRAHTDVPEGKLPTGGNICPHHLVDVPYIVTYSGSVHETVSPKGSHAKGSAVPQGIAGRPDEEIVADGTTAATAFEALCLEDSDESDAVSSSAASVPSISAADVYQALLTADSEASDSDAPSAGAVYAALMAEDSDDSMASGSASSPSVSAHDAYRALIEDSDDSMASAPASPTVSAAAVYEALVAANDSDEAIADEHSGTPARQGPWHAGDFNTFRDPEEYL